MANKTEQFLSQAANSISVDRNWAKKQKQMFLQYAAAINSDQPETNKSVFSRLDSFLDKFITARHLKLAFATLIVVALVLTLYFNTVKQPLTETTENESAVEPSLLPELARAREKALKYLSNSQQYIDVAKLNGINTAEVEKMFAEAKTQFNDLEFAASVATCTRINAYLDQFIMANRPVFHELDTELNETDGGVNANEPDLPAPNPFEPTQQPGTGIAGEENIQP